MSTEDDLRRTARESFGWDELRPGQLEAMTALMGGRDVLAVMATGSGKSAVYQVPALLIPGPTVVVSPLISLQHDQVEGLLERPDEAGGAVAANSQLTPRQHAETLERYVAGDLEFLFLSPEQLARDDTLDALKRAGTSLVVVDEAHCVSAWGHDFRPDYLRIGSVIDALGHPPVAALTATASPPVRAEIVDRLHLRDPLVLVRGFDRPTIHLAVDDAHGDDADKRRRVVEQVAGRPKPALVYVGTRAETSSYAGELAGLGLTAVAYHGGMKAADRDAVHERWLGDDVDVVVATSAFGMGIDKPDVRTVVHADPPESLDEYLQEVGRAGRDGEPAEALLVWRPEDLSLRRFFGAGGLPSVSQLRKVATLVAHAPHPPTLRELADEADLSPARTTKLVDLLEQAGALWLDADGRLVVPDGAPDPEQAAQAAREHAEQHQRVDESRVDMVRLYAETRGCRRQLLLASFGETLPEPCGHCDRCEAGLEAGEEVDQVDSPYPVGARVRHASWGEGLVVRYEGDRVVALFDAEGYRTLALQTVIDHGLLEVV